MIVKIFYYQMDQIWLFLLKHSIFLIRLNLQLFQYQNLINIFVKRSRTI
jgi:hypothetical protein